jgi:methylated-DNA-protein-cysteine methyltransferase-like protein
MSAGRRMTHAQIFAVVRRIPRGCVATYGQVAALAGFPNHARQVGYALSALSSDAPVPWHRVVNAQGRISPRRDDPGGAMVQQLRLEQEGVVLMGGRVALADFGWAPNRRSARSSVKASSSRSPAA